MQGKTPTYGERATGDLCVPLPTISGVMTVTTYHNAVASTDPITPQLHNLELQRDYRYAVDES